MNSYYENLNDIAIKRCLKNVSDATVSLSRCLSCIDIPLRGIFVDHWPEYDKDSITIKIWDGNRHIPALIDNEPSRDLTISDVAAIVKRKLILSRKF